MCIMTVAAHAGLPAVVVRHAHELLSDLLDIDNTQVRGGTDQDKHHDHMGPAGLPYSQAAH